MKTKDNGHCCGSPKHINTLFDEFVCHFPYAVFSLTIGLIILALVTPGGGVALYVVKHSFHRLFHTFHFMHILFASAGAILTFFRYSRNFIKGILVGTISPAFFCMLSDILLPYVAGRILGVKMSLHICFINEFSNIGIFLILGVMTGFILRFHVDRCHESSLFTSWLHFGHILLSSMASMFYMVANGFLHWDKQMGMVFALLIVAVVVPCTFSDVIVPFVIARDGKK